MKTLDGSKCCINMDLQYILAYLVKDYAQRLQDKRHTPIGHDGYRATSVDPWPASPARASGIANAPGFAKDASIAGKFI